MSLYQQTVDEYMDPNDVQSIPVEEIGYGKWRNLRQSGIFCHSLVNFSSAGRS